MERQNLVRALKSHSDGADVITKSQFMSFMGIKKYDHIKKYLSGLDAIDGKYYLISEVAGALLRRTC